LLQIKTSAPAGPQNEDASNVILPWNLMSEIKRPEVSLQPASGNTGTLPRAVLQTGGKLPLKGISFITFQSFKESQS
jgi:hypothetical protein